MRILILILAYLLPIAAFAQVNRGGGYRHQRLFTYNDAKMYGRDKFWQRSSIGAGLWFTNATINARYQTDVYTRNSFFPHTDTSVAVGINTGTSTICFYEDGFIPIAKLSDNSGLSIALGTTVALIKFNSSVVSLGEGSEAISYEGNVKGLSVGLPVGLDYRSGADYFLDKSRRTMFSIGVGIAPTFLAVSYELARGEDNNPAKTKPIKFLPYVRAELGFFAGIAFKLRATTYLGKPTYFDVTNYDEDTDTQLDISMKGKGYGCQLGLLIMPWSWDWDSDY